MKILVACEESQAVCIEFRKLGHEAFSCDLQPCSGGHPEWHYQGDVFEIINQGWDLMIAHPPCTHLAVSGARHFAKKIADGRQQEGIDLFMKFTQTNVNKWAIENPVGIMSKLYRSPDQIVQPYYFGDEVQKTTCLWLHNLPKLYHSKEVDLFQSNVTHVSNGGYTIFKSGKRHPKWYADTFCLPSAERSKARSKTFPGIAKAMAKQWGKNIEL